MSISSSRIIAIAVAPLFIACAIVLAADALPKAPTSGPATASAPATTSAAAEVPQEVFAKMAAVVNQRPDANATEEQAKAKFIENLKAMVKIGEQAEQDYPTASNLYVIRYQLLRATAMLGQIGEDPAYEKKAQEVAKRMLKSDSPAEVRIQADVFLMHSELMANKNSPEKVTKLIRDFLARWDATTVKPMAVIYGVRTSIDLGVFDLADELLGKLKTEFAENQMTDSFVASLNYGKVFDANLTKLDGAPLNLPKDLQGKIVVVEFWASWCDPCKREAPKMKEAYTKYKAHGVEFVGISLDRQKDDAAKFINENKLDWIQTYDGDQNPVAMKYHIEGIPTMWVVNKEGKVVSDNARGQLTEVLDRMLGLTSTTQPTTAPTTAPGSK